VDAGNYGLGVGLTVKYSTRVAQGLGAGVLYQSYRFKSINDVDPMPWLAALNRALSSMTIRLREESKPIL